MLQSKPRLGYVCEALQPRPKLPGKSEGQQHQHGRCYILWGKGNHHRSPWGKVTLAPLPHVEQWLLQGDPYCVPWPRRAGYSGSLYYPSPGHHLFHIPSNLCLVQAPPSHWKAAPPIGGKTYCQLLLWGILLALTLSVQCSCWASESLMAFLWC